MDDRLESALVSEVSDFILFAQHGWADNDRAIAKMAQTLATPHSLLIVPDLGWVKTWLRIQPLIAQVEKIASEAIDNYPHIPIRIMGHSMGGLIWLEVLQRHPEWWQKVESFVLVASPVGGADLARILDPLGIGIGIAADLGKNRRQMAQAIAKVIPTLAIAGDVDGGSDGTITLETTKFPGAKWVCLPNLPHAILKNHPAVVEVIQEFWQNPVITPAPPPDFTTTLIERLQSVPGMTDAHWRDFSRAKIYLTFPNGVTIRRWKNTVQVEHVFVANHQGECLYGGFVGWVHIPALLQALGEIGKWELGEWG